MEREKGRDDMRLAQSSKKRKIRRVPNRFSNMTKDDWKESNDESKKNRGLSRLSLREINGEEK